MTPEYQLQAACVKLFAMLKPNEAGRLFLNLNNPRSSTNGHFLKMIGLTAGVADMTYLSDNAVPQNGHCSRRFVTIQQYHSFVPFLFPKTKLL